jgi:hypothetical protein
MKSTIRLPSILIDSTEEMKEKLKNIGRRFSEKGEQEEDSLLQVNEKGAKYGKKEKCSNIKYMKKIRKDVSLIGLIESETLCVLPKLTQKELWL